MATGILIAESLREDATLHGSWQLTGIERLAVAEESEAQRAAGLPSAWTLLHVELDDTRARALVQVLADALLCPGWCAEFTAEAETFTVFAGRVFRYPSDDGEARADAHAYGRAHGVPSVRIASASKH